FDQFYSFHGRLHGGGAQGLHRDDLGLGRKGAEGPTKAGDKPPAPHWDKEVINGPLGLLDDFKSHGGLALYDLWVIKGMDKTLAPFHTKGLGRPVGIVKGIPFQHDLHPVPAEHFGLIHLLFGGHHGHEYGSVHLLVAAGKGHTLGMVSGTGTDHAPLQLGLGQGSDLVEGSTDLIASDPLQVLPFEENTGPVDFGISDTVLQGGRIGHLGDPLCSLPNIHQLWKIGFPPFFFHGTQALFVILWASWPSYWP